jgi:hypothetical protein
MASRDVSQELRDRIAACTNLRARRLLELILEHGEVTTHDLRTRYGYEHAPRAKRDAVELGFPVLATQVVRDGRRMAAYTLGDAADMLAATGRRQFSRAFRDALVAKYGEKCNQCGGSFPARALQIDHRVPYEVGGDGDESSLDEFQLLCGSCNRSKSWTCEHCPNWETRDPATCASCLWASPEGYDHIATVQRRQLTVTWDADDVAEFDRLRAEAEASGRDLEGYARDKLS